MKIIGNYRDVKELFVLHKEETCIKFKCKKKSNRPQDIFFGKISQIKKEFS